MKKSLLALSVLFILGACSSIDDYDYDSGGQDKDISIAEHLGNKKIRIQEADIEIFGSFNNDATRLTLTFDKAYTYTTKGDPTAGNTNNALIDYTGKDPQGEDLTIRLSKFSTSSGDFEMIRTAVILPKGRFTLMTDDNPGNSTLPSGVKSTGDKILDIGLRNALTKIGSTSGFTRSMSKISDRWVNNFVYQRSTTNIYINTTKYKYVALSSANNRPIDFTFSGSGVGYELYQNDLVIKDEYSVNVPSTLGALLQGAGYKLYEYKNFYGVKTSNYYLEKHTTTTVSRIPVQKGVGQPAEGATGFTLLGVNTVAEAEGKASEYTIMK
ncbi:MAG: hypothetical protein ACRC0X_03205 [Brevinema sp.]